MTLKKILGTLAALLLTTVALIGVSAGTANADDGNSNACTRLGYSASTKHSHKVQNPRNDGPGGTVYDYYGNGRNCAVLIVYINSSDTKLCIQRQSDLQKVCDQGPFDSYAGPVVISAPRTCIRITGYVNGVDSPYTDTVDTGWERCG